MRFALGLFVAGLMLAQQPKTRAELEAELASTQAALAKLDNAGDAKSGADAQHCEKLLHQLISDLQDLTAQSQEQAQGLIDHVDTGTDDVRSAVADTKNALIDNQVQQTQVVASEVHQVREVQSQSVEAAKQAADNSARNLTAQILGFLTLLATFLIREQAARRERRENSQQIAMLTRVVGASAPLPETPHAPSESNP